MTYNITALQNSDSLIELTSYANTVAENALMGMFMLAIFFVMVMVLKKWEIEKAVVVSSILCFVLSCILVYADLLSFIFPIAFLALAGLTTLYMYTTDTI